MPRYDRLWLSHNQSFSYSTKDRELLGSLYYENDKNAFFEASFFYNEVTANYNLYRLSNYLLLIYEIQESSVSSVLKDNILKYLDSIYEEIMDGKLKLSEILYFVNITTCLKIEKYDKEIADYINAKYSLQTMLYCEEENNNDIIDQINDTNVALKILNKIGVLPENIEGGLGEALNDLIMNPQYFTFDYTDFWNNIFYSGLTILENCALFNEQSRNCIIDIWEALDWFIYWSEYFINYINTGECNLMEANTGLLKTVYISRLYALDLDIYNYLSDLKKNNWIELLAQDPKVTYESLYLLKLFNQKLPISEETIDNYILFVFDTLPDIRIKEQYFGYKLAELLQLEINEESFISTLSNRITSNSTVEELFYFILINIELKNDNTFKKQYESLYQQVYIDNASQIMQSSSLSTIYYILYIGGYFDWPILPKKEMVNEIHRIAQNTDLEQDIYWYALILDIYGVEKDMDLLSNAMNDFFGENGYAVSKSNLDLINIFSTYRMMVVAQNCSLTLDSSFLDAFLCNCRGDNGGYFIMEKTDGLTDYRDNFSLQSFYYGVALELFVE